jgi:tetratricopeptide (TPR) repeat protein
MSLLAGYPLTLQVVLPHLAGKTAAAVLDELRQGLAAADAAAPAGDPVAARTQSLMACIDYSHGHLDPEAQALLACFAPFIGVITTDFLDSYRKALTEELALAGVPLDRLGKVLERTRSLGLVQRDANLPMILRPQPALSWFLTNRLTAPEQTERRQAIERAYRSFYDGYAGALSGFQDSNDPQQRQLAQMLVELEYANIGTALRWALDQQQSILRPYLVLSTHLDRLQDHRRGLELGELVLTQLERVPPEAVTGMRGAELVGVIDNIAKRQLQLHQLDRAKASYEQALAILNALDGLDPRMAAGVRAGILHQLGVVAQQQRRFDDAEAAYKQALAIYNEFNDRHSAARTYYGLGNVAFEQRRFDDAEAAYKQALAICIEFNDRYEQAGTYHQLGNVALEQRRFDEAEAAYKQALEIWVTFRDEHRLEIVLGSLARLWRLTNAASIPAAVAATLNIDPAEAEALLKKFSS